MLAATPMAVSGVRKSWLNEASKAVFSRSLCRVSSPALTHFEEVRALDRQGDESSQGFEGTGLHGSPRRRENSDRPGARPEGTRSTSRPSTEIVRWPA